MSRIAFTIALWILPFAAGAAMGRDIYVDNVSGNDRNNGSQAVGGTVDAGPLKTIARALWIAQAGDRIVLSKNAEPYREMVCLTGPRNSGLPDQPFVIEGNGATIDGAGLIDPEDWDNAEGELVKVRFRYMAYPMLFDGDKLLPRMKVAGPADLKKLQAGQWASYRGQVYFYPAPEKSLFEYPLAGASLATGITLYQVSGVEIRDLTVQGFRIDGVSAPDAAEGVTLTRVVSRANGRSGLSVGGTSKVIAAECQFHENGAVPARIEGYAKLNLSGSLLSPTKEIEQRGGKLKQD